MCRHPACEGVPGCCDGAPKDGKRQGLLWLNRSAGFSIGAGGLKWTEIQHIQHPRVRAASSDRRASRRRVRHTVGPKIVAWMHSGCPHNLTCMPRCIIPFRGIHPTQLKFIWAPHVRKMFSMRVQSKYRQMRQFSDVFSALK